jgi:hypothetical protein
MRFVYLIIVLAFVSCVKDVDLPLDQSDGTMVVNCLFCEDSVWKVSLSRIRTFTDQTESRVTDARVWVISANNDTIKLSHFRKGIYTSAEKPLGGVKYRLLVDAGKSGTLSAISSIPYKPMLSDFKPSTQNTIFFSNPNLSDYQVVPLSLRITANNELNYVRFRLMGFLLGNGFVRYQITKYVIWDLREQGFPEDILLYLDSMKGVSFSNYHYRERIESIAKKYSLTNNQRDSLSAALKKIKVTTRFDDSFNLKMIFANSFWLSNVSKDEYNVLGEYRGTQDVSLLLDYLHVLYRDETSSKEEYWLETVGMSEAYYKYQKSYIKQVTNQQNPFASVVEVYSNIENGVGIFAGYNRQMIHFKDY